MKKIILASTSENRKELLEQAGISFDVVGSDYEEDMTLPFAPLELAMHLSRGKAEAVAKNYTDAIIIAADTFIAFEDQVIGKPYTPEKNKEQLRLMSGAIHSIITGVAIIDTGSGKSISQAVESKVHFREISEAEIEEYVATGEGLKRAAGYAIQNIGKKFVDKIEGDYTSAVGLPMDVVIKTLKDFGAMD